MKYIEYVSKCYACEKISDCELRMFSLQKVQKPKKLIIDTQHRVI